MSGITVDGQTYSVKTTDEVIGGDDGERAILGMESEGHNIVIIDGTMPATRMAETFLHEMIHIVMPSLPEQIVGDLGRRLYGALSDNGLLIDDMLGLVSDGVATSEEMKQVNKLNNEVLHQPTFGFMRVSEKFWTGPVFKDSGELLIRDGDGALNRSAVHIATAQLLGAQGGLKIATGKKRLLACDLLELYRDVLREPLPKPLVEMSW
jgi:hypothetical protein